MQLITEKILTPTEPNGKAVLLVHGWTGFPETVLPLGLELQKAGFYVLMPVLSGHGCTEPAEFIAAKSHDWERNVDDAYDKLLRKFDRENVYLAGLSMGALLSLKLAFKVRTSRLVLMAPAIQNKDWMIWLTPVLQLFTKFWKNEKPREDNMDLGQVADNLERTVYGAYTWVSPAFQLLKLQLAVQSLLKHDRMIEWFPVRTNDSKKALILWAKDDEAVPETAPKLIFDALSLSNSPWATKLEVLETGHHVLPYFSAAANAKVVEFLKS